MIRSENPYVRERAAWTAGVVAVLLLHALPGTLLAQRVGEPPSPAVQQAMQALRGALQSSNAEMAERFLEERLTDRYRAELGEGAGDHIDNLREATRGSFGDMNVSLEPGGVIIMRLGGGVALRLVLEESSARFDAIELHDPPASTSIEAVTEQRLRAVEELRPRPESIAKFSQEHLSATLRADPETEATLQQIARAAATAGMINYDFDNGDHIVQFRGGGRPTHVRVSISATEPFLIERLRIDPDGDRSPGS